MMMGGGSSLPNGAPFDILNLKVGEKGEDVIPLPSRLSTIERHDVKDAVNQNNPRSFTLAMQGMVHTINNRLFEMDSVARDEILQLGDLEIWEFANLEGGEGGGGMGMMNMEMPHPMHIHGVQFQVLICFENYAGTFLYHCHNLEHEDAGMMRNYKIES